VLSRRALLVVLLFGLVTFVTVREHKRQSRDHREK
jgi:hypothetical protein